MSDLIIKIGDSPLDLSDGETIAITKQAAKVGNIVQEHESPIKARCIKKALFEDFNIRCNSIVVQSENPDSMAFIIDNKKAVFHIEKVNLLFRTWRSKDANSIPSGSDFNNFCAYIFSLIK